MPAPLHATVAAAAVVASLCLVLAHTAQARADPEAAIAKNKEALALAYENELRKALPLFEEAYALDEENAEIANNVGVTMMRLGKLENAQKYFNRALEIQPGHNEALLNLKDLAAYLEPAAKVDVEAADALPPHHTEKFPRLTVAEYLSKPRGIKHAMGRAPFILKDAFKFKEGTWDSAQNKWSLDYFEEHFADSLVDFYPHNMDDEQVRPYITELPQVMKELVHPSGQFASDPMHPGTYAQWNLDNDEWKRLMVDFGWLPPQFTSDDGWLHSCFSSEAMIGTYLKSTHWRMILIGTKGAGMFNHVDTLRTASFQAQLMGRKKWHVCGPSQNEYMYKAGAVDFFNPNYAVHPKARNASCFLDTVKAGEMVFYPRDWWHQTENLEDINIAVTGTLVDGNNFDSVQEELTQDCERPSPVIIPKNPKMCAELERCYDWWREAWQGDFKATSALSKHERTCPRKLRRKEVSTVRP